MERSREYEDLAVALAEVRSAPRDEFAAELDERVAAGFPRKPRLGDLQITGVRFRGLLSPRRLLAICGAAAVAAIGIATVVVTSNDSAPGPVALGDRHHVERPHHVQFSEPIPAPEVSGQASGSGATAAEGDSAEPQSSTALPESGVNYTNGALGHPAHREIERSAEIGLLADPADVADDSAKVFSAVHDARGIVLHSTTTAGRNAGANFDLLIPSAKLGDALAAFSAIDEVSSRHEATADITAQTVALGEQLQDSRAKIDGLLAQLASAETEAESEAIGIQLHAERRHAAQLRAHLAQLHRRTSFSRVSVRIESGASTESGGAWGIDDAFSDAGHILGIAAGVTVIVLAVIAPLAALLFTAWLAQRLWLRARRERALDA